YTITVDASKQTTGNPRFWSAAVGTGVGIISVRADWQTHAKIANRELSIQRVRGHGALSDDKDSMAILKGSGTGAPSYYWTNVDAAAAVLPDRLRGQPAHTEPSKIAAFLQHCKSANKRVTFASAHYYPGACGDSPANAAGLTTDNNTRVSQIMSGGYTTSQVM